MREGSLIIIPARGGSKGIPGKNIKPLNGKPLIHYSLEYARHFANDKDICVTTDSTAIADCVADLGYTVPFIRPAELATDTAGSYEVLLHALHFYEQQGKSYDSIILLQPTSPFRKKEHLVDALKLYNPSVDMVVSVTEPEANPYYNLFEENKDGFLTKSKTGTFERRQDCPKIYQYNGSFYIINTTSLKQRPLTDFNKIVKYVMPIEYSHDLDTPYDWQLAELLIHHLK